MKVRDGPAHIFVAVVAQHVEFGPVRPDDDAFGRHDVQRHGAVLEEIFELVLLVAQVPGDAVKLGCVVEAVNGAGHGAAFISDGEDMDHRPHTGAVRPFDNPFSAPDRLARGERMGHGGLPAGDLAAAEKQAVRPAEALG
jgi:hypothetical protein